MRNVSLIVDFGDIKGECKIDGHEDQVLAYDLKWKIEQKSAPGTGTGRTQSRAIIGDVNVSKALDASSSLLALAAMRGDHIEKIVIYWNRDSGAERIDVVEITLDECVISGYEIGDVNANDPNKEEILVDNVKISFGHITYLYRQQANDGSVEQELESEFDVTTGK